MEEVAAVEERAAVEELAAVKGLAVMEELAAVCTERAGVVLSLEEASDPAGSPRNFGEG